jgi:hypothetical protein
MADFGNTGEITVRESIPGVEVNVTDGEYLFYQLTVSGAIPIFVFACTHETRLAASQFDDHPKAVYEWTWSRTAQMSADIPNVQSDADDSGETYGVVMHFAAAIKYTLVVEHRDRDDNLIETLKDMDFETQAPEEFFSEGLLVSEV